MVANPESCVLPPMVQLVPLVLEDIDRDNMDNVEVYSMVQLHDLVHIQMWAQVQVPMQTQVELLTRVSVDQECTNS